eukprot:4814250-Prymnesium_polylepis.1
MCPIEANGDNCENDHVFTDGRYSCGAVNRPKRHNIGSHPPRSVDLRHVLPKVLPRLPWRAAAAAAEVVRLDASCWVECYAASFPHELRG